MIEIKEVSKIYDLKNRKVVAVDNVSLSINDGDIFGIIGYSGAGKSTLVRMINQLETQDKGKILIDGHELNKLSPKQLRQLRTKIGMIFQHFNLLWSRTVSENIELALQIAGIKDKHKRQQRVKELVDLVGLTGRENAYPSELSGGQKQRVGIARALANDPKILLCDEATSALDPDTTKSILDLLLEINRKLKITIVMITHQMEVVQKICNRVAVMSEGKVVEEGNVKKIFTMPKHPVTKSFIRDIKNNNEFDLDVLKNIYSNGKLLKVIFDENTSRTPILTNVIRQCDSFINVIEANLTNTIDSSFGIMILEVTGDYKKVIELFNKYHVEVEVM
ncbi:methionine ABC transporter ATP-binding protein [Thomasclavelia spiroformis]|uniref:methionine ABC transporter ATP-binding protein n=1 Tax=Thomasclavelia spiroformis TaxID=29348 RepID=UPI00255B8C4F|nr:methionine ABC transporter ATP-binding protein [Thomasclavelia spiroformis]